MTYKESLFFIGKCLTLSHESKNKKLVEETIQNERVDWDKIVQISTSHYVFPALYCNLKRADLLSYLPKDLVEYMIHITNLNRERNQQIIEQAKELNHILSAHSITPIYVKGTGFLLNNLYEDIGERMVGDIDFLFSEKDFKNATNILLKNGYSKVDKTTYDYPQFKHYPRLQKENRIAAIEIHKQLIIEKYVAEFNYTTVSKDTIAIDNFKVLSFNNQLALSIIAKQVNDDGYYFKNMALRNAYDVFLLSQKTNSKIAVENFNTLLNPLNCFLASCSKVFDNVDSIKYIETAAVKKYLSFFEKQLTDASFRKKHRKKWTFILFFKIRFAIILKVFYKKEYRSWFFKRITDKNWWKEKLN